MIEHLPITLFIVTIFTTAAALTFKKKPLVILAVILYTIFFSLALYGAVQRYHQETSAPADVGPPELSQNDLL